MFTKILIFILTNELASADIATEDIQYLNELPLDHLLRLKNSLQGLVTVEYENATTPAYFENFGAQAMAMKSPPIRRGDYEEHYVKKGDYSKISNIFSMSVTTLAFLAFGGYLLCLIVHAVRAKQMYYNNPAAVPTQPQTFVLNAGIKKRPQPQFSASYGRRKREAAWIRQVDIPPEELFTALQRLCEGYAKWSEGKTSVTT